MTRVGFFVDTFNIGGAETVVLQLASQLLKDKDFNPVIIHFNAGVIKERCEQLDIPQLSAPAHNYYKKTVTLPLFAFGFYRFLRRHKIDVLHSHLFGAIIGAAPAARMGNITHIGTLHDIYTIEDRPSRIWLLKLASVLGTKLVTVSQQMEAYYRQQGHFKKDKLETIYNGVDISTLEPSIGTVREELGIASDEVVITCVARLVELKRHDILIKAFKEVTGSKSRLLVVGGGPERQALEKLVDKYILSERVIFLGERTDVATILNESDIFCLTSDTEGLSCSILEAMAASLPVLATNVGGNSELVSNNVNGFLITKGSVIELALKLQLLIDNKELRLQFAKNSLLQVSKNFQWADTYNNYKNLYRIKK